MYKEVKLLLIERSLQAKSELQKKLEDLGYSNIIVCSKDFKSIEKILGFKTELVILDCSRSWIECAEVVQTSMARGLKTKFIFICPLLRKEEYQSFEALSISGYIITKNKIEEIEECINVVLQGGSYVSKKLIKDGMYRSLEDIHFSKLTSSEVKILKLISMSYTTPQIANELFISQKTVEKHRSNISKKLKLSGKTNSLLLWAKEHAAYIRDMI